MKKSKNSMLHSLEDKALPKANRPTIDCSNDPGKTERNLVHLCDINHILKMHNAAGVSPQMPQVEFSDYTNVPDYQTALNTVMKIDDMFDSLPSNVRQHFNQILPPY